MILLAESFPTVVSELSQPFWFVGKLILRVYWRSNPAVASSRGKERERERKRDIYIERRREIEVERDKLKERVLGISILGSWGYTTYHISYEPSALPTRHANCITRPGFEPRTKPFMSHDLLCVLTENWHCILYLLVKIT